MIAPLRQLNAKCPSLLSDKAIERVWRGSVAPGRKLPQYEDVVLGSLGRLGDHILLFEGSTPADFKVLRSGRKIREWLGTDLRNKKLDDLPRDCAVALDEVLAQAVASAVNLSPAQFRNRGVVKAVLTALAYSRLPPSRLELEITESVLLGETEANLATLYQLREIGVRISMDDFGTGYSSLSYLRSFPFDKIKIDRSFVSELAVRPDCVAIIRAVAGLGLSLGIATTAEGIETPEQLERVRAEGCTEVQGYFFSPPRPASELDELIAADMPKQAAVA